MYLNIKNIYKIQEFSAFSISTYLLFLQCPRVLEGGSCLILIIIVYLIDIKKFEWFRKLTAM